MLVIWHENVSTLNMHMAITNQIVNRGQHVAHRSLYVIAMDTKVNLTQPYLIDTSMCLHISYLYISMVVSSQLAMKVKNGI